MNIGKQVFGTNSKEAKTIEQAEDAPGDAVVTAAEGLVEDVVQGGMADLLRSKGLPTTLVGFYQMIQNELAVSGGDAFKEFGPKAEAAATTFVNAVFSHYLPIVEKENVTF